MRRFGVRMAAVGAALGAVIAAGVVSAAPAGAGTVGGYNANAQPQCWYNVCLYYNSPNLGWGAEWYSTQDEVANLGQLRFSTQSTGSSGNNYYVKNQAASGANSDWRDDYIYVNSSTYGWGAYDMIPGGTGGRLLTTYNNDAAYSKYVH